jgi:hypothetical protein
MDEQNKERNKVIIGALKECVSRDALDDTFSKYAILESSNRIRLS